jgi:NADH-quinone oxidoreductase subunit E
MTLSDQTYDELREIAGRYPVARSGLLPMLHLVQSVEGSVTDDGIAACADTLGLTAAEVSSVASFYSMYKRSVVGTHHVGVCTNTLCAVMGGDIIFERLCEHLGIGNDQTTEDGRITLEHVECNAACDYAPVVMVNWEFVDQQTPDSAVALVDRLRAGETVEATRGATITSWREAERVLAGYDDGRVDEGPSAGEPSLVGLRIAREAGTAEEPSAGGAGDAGAGVPEDKAGAVAESDTHRAESETVAETETPAGTGQGTGQGAGQGTAEKPKRTQAPRKKAEPKPDPKPEETDQRSGDDA